MAPTNDKPSDLERTVSTRTSVRISLGSLDEDYEFAAGGMVADGFRPTYATNRTEPSTPSLASGSSTIVGEDSPGSSSRPAQRPNTPKFQLVLNSSSRQESTGLTRQATNSTESTVYHPSDSPYQGPSAPSHPYQMYPQNVRLARTMSTTTTTTTTASVSSYSGPRGPSHPYSLYPQTDGIESSATQAPPIPLGFHGLPDQYQRRIGPEGEDADDIIGPDGHTEQLPPYTRYPDEAYLRKAAAVEGVPDVVRGVATPLPAIVTAPVSAALTIPGAGGIGLATRNPEFESTEDLGSRRSRHSTRSFASDDSVRRLNTDTGEISEKKKPLKKWQVWMSRKACRVVPYWALCLTGIVLLVMAIVLGVVIGVVLDKDEKPPRKKPDWEPTFDVSPIPTPPPDLQPLPTGTFGMPLMTNRVSSTCFQDPTLSQAWKCNQVISGLQLAVLKDDRDYLASLDCNHSLTLMNNVYAYGQQPPLIQKPVVLELVEDKFEQHRGPAWFKLLSYNKTVILPEGLLNASGSSQQQARHVASISAGISNFKRKGVAQPGEKPWICNWPNTYLELFIFPQQNSSYSNWPNLTGTFLTSSSTETTSTSFSTTSSTTSAPSLPPTSTDGSYDDDPFPDGGTEQKAPGETDTVVHTGFPYGGHKSNWIRGAAHSPESTSSSSTESSTTFTTSTITETSSFTATMPGPFGPIDTGDSVPLPPPPYPKVVKLEERRVSTSGAPMAQCTQVEIQGPGQEARIVRHHNGRPVVIDLVETETFTPGPPPSTPDLSKRSSLSPFAVEEERVQAMVLSRGDGGAPVPDISPCGCIWYLT